MAEAFRSLDSVSLKFAIVICGNLVVPSLAVFNGTPVAPFEFPELVRIYRCGGTKCTGSILNRHWIITSAFCLTDATYRVFNFSEFVVNVGDHDAAVREPSEQNLTIVDVVIHNHYK